VILRSPLAFYTTNEANKLVVDLSAMNDIVHYDNTYYEVNGIVVQKGSQEIRADIPYIKSLKRFYPMLREYVAKVLAFETDKTIIDRFITSVDG
jgi:hypothetical protein